MKRRWKRTFTSCPAPLRRPGSASRAFHRCRPPSVMRFSLPPASGSASCRSRSNWCSRQSEQPGSRASIKMMTTANPLAYLSEQLDTWRKAGSYQRLRVLESPCEPISRFDGHEVINLASNNYLGLADHLKLIDAQVAAAKKFGAGSGAVRTISGTMSIHMQ